MDELNVKLNEGILVDRQEELAGYIKRMPEFDYMTVSLATAISSQLGNGIFVRAFPFWKRGIPVTYDFKQNRLYVNSATIEVLSAFFKSINPFNEEKKRFSSVIKNTALKDAIGGICYYGIHIYNMKNRGILIKDPLTMRFYREYFRRMIYDNTKLSTLSNKVSELMYMPYLNTIKEYYEVRGYTGADFNKDQEKKLNYMFSQFSDRVKIELDKWGFDYSAVETYSTWYADFMKDLKTIFLNRKTVVMKQDDQFMLRQENILKTLTLTPLYSTYKSVGGARTDVEKDRFPTAPFKELYCTAEPIAQIINSLAKQNKLKDNEAIQSIASKGIAYLNPHPHL